MAVPNFANLTMLVVVFFVAIAIMACRPSAMPTESESSASPKQSEQSGPALLLDEASAIVILQTYLQECVLSWDRVYAKRAITSEMSRRSQARRSAEIRSLRGTFSPTSTPAPLPTASTLPQPEQEKQSVLMGLATGTVEGVAWSATYHGVTEVPKLVARYGPSKAETWLVIGPGFNGPDTSSVVPGRWKVYAGVERVDYVDAPARLALEPVDDLWNTLS